MHACICICICKRFYHEDASANIDHVYRNYSHELGHAELRVGVVCGVWYVAKSIGSTGGTGRDETRRDDDSFHFITATATEAGSQY